MAGSGLANGRFAVHINLMSNAPLARLFEVKLTALHPGRWEWQVYDGEAMLMSGYETSRETAQIEGDSALFLLLRSKI
jgi:hypothetical protein